MNYYVYLYLNPLKKNEPFYVGKGKGKRAYAHLYNSIKETNLHKSRTTNQIKQTLGVDPIIQIYANNLSEEEAFIIETKLIKEYGRVDNNTGILTNMTNGGDGGSSGCIFTKERKNKIKIAALNQFKNGMPIETKEKISKSRLGKHLSEKTKTKLRNIKKGKPRSKEMQDKLRTLFSGRQHSEETKRKMSESHKKRYQNLS